MIWRLQDAEKQFSQVVNDAMNNGPQIVTKHGLEVVVVLSFDEYQALKKPKPNILDLLMDEAFFGSELALERDRGDFGRSGAEDADG